MAEVDAKKGEQTNVKIATEDVCMHCQMRRCDSFADCVKLLIELETMWCWLLCRQHTRMPDAPAPCNHASHAVLLRSCIQQWLASLH
jgi:hypothetical protein